jgi:hypothetical protein
LTIDGLTSRAPAQREMQHLCRAFHPPKSLLYCAQVARESTHNEVEKPALAGSQSLTWTGDHGALMVVDIQAWRHVSSTSDGDCVPPKSKEPRSGMRKSVLEAP